MQSLRVVLINPPPLAVVEPWYDRPDWGRIGLAYLAAYLQQFDGYQVDIIDAKLERLGFEDVTDRVVDLEPHVVGFTAFTNEIKPAAYQAALIKDRLPAAITLIGGVHVTALPQQTLEEFHSFDMGVVGEGEQTLAELCRAIRDGLSFESIAGVVYRDDGQVVQTAPRHRVLDQDSIPHPAWDLFPVTPEYWLQTLRGCPFNCVFCMNHNGRLPRMRSVENVIEEIELLIERYGARRLRFGDELFTIDMERSHALMDAMIARGLGDQVEWDCQTHVRFVDRELLEKMKRAGCYRVELGIETGDEQKLKEMGKGTTLEMILAAAESARQAELPFGTFFIIGHPHETRESIAKTVALVVRMNPDLPMIGLMCPYPGTLVSQMAANGEGGYRLVTTDWDEFNKQIGGALEFAGLKRSQLEWIQIAAYLKVFIRNHRYKDLVKFLWHYRWGGWQVMRKALLGRSTLKRPLDYEEKLGHGRAATVEDIRRARLDWEDVQKSELVWARRPLDTVGVR